MKLSDNFSSFAGLERSARWTWETRQTGMGDMGDNADGRTDALNVAAILWHRENGMKFWCEGKEETKYPNHALILIFVIGLVFPASAKVHSLQHL